MGRFLNLPPIPEIPAEIRGKSFVIVEAFHLGDPAEADHLLAPLRALGPVNDTIATIPVPAMSHPHMDPEQPSPGAGDGLLLDRLPAEAIDAVTATAGAGAAFPLVSVEVRHLGGEFARPRPENGALASVEARYGLYAVGMTPAPGMIAPVMAQVGAIKDALAPWAARQMYLNFAETVPPPPSGPGRPTTGCAGSRPPSTRTTSSVPTTPSRRPGEIDAGPGPGHCRPGPVGQAKPPGNRAGPPW